MLKQRIITSLILTFGYGLCIFLLPNLIFSGIMAITVTIAAWEWANLAGFSKQLSRILFAILTLALILVWLFCFTTTLNISQGEFVFQLMPIFFILYIGLAVWLLQLVWMVRFPNSDTYLSHPILTSLTGLFFLLAFWISASQLRNQGLVALIAPIFIVGFADIGAFFFGKKFGKRKLAPKVSPGKSWEGFWGGVSSSMSLAVLNLFLIESVNWKQIVLVLALFLVTALAAVLGDLVESMYKRHRGIKDSSHLLPGHGGLLDRMDSHLCAMPCYTLGMLCLEQYFNFNPFSWAI